MTVSALPPSAVTIRLVAGLVARQVWPLLAFLAALTVGATWWWLEAGDGAPLRLAVRFLALAVFGVVGSFSLHEFGHLLVLRRADGVIAVRLERAAWRVSVVPIGVLTQGRAVTAAVAGPLCCTVVGLGLLAVPVARVLAWC